MVSKGEFLVFIIVHRLEQSAGIIGKKGKEKHRPGKEGVTKRKKQ